VVRLRDFLTGLREQGDKEIKEKGDKEIKEYSAEIEKHYGVCMTGSRLVVLFFSLYSLHSKNFPL